MRVCEVCGAEEQMEIESSVVMQIRMLHICDNCRSDRSFQTAQNEEL